MTTFFFAWYDKDSDFNIIAFGTQDEIANDCLTGEDLDYDEISDIKEFFDDSGSLCEDYLISTYIPLTEINKELTSRGFIKDKRLKNTRWG